ncbi:uncharacterized protein LOC119179266 isoform X5 [Rhipicephalus microplus]|uniref:uncharacterized protein LOC119179266 isoform X5 n=1 Tax=Rhipicephalus microplus TaxID=6941 RepID=UPI003F6BAC77
MHCASVVCYIFLCERCAVLFELRGERSVAADVCRNERLREESGQRFEIRRKCVERRRPGLRCRSMDGNCQPRRSSVVLRAIRVRNEDEEGVERLWKRTHPDHIGEKRWKLRFEKDQPISGVPIFPNVKKWTTFRATASKSLLTRAVESATRLMDLRLSWIIVILAVVCLFGLWLGKSGLAPYSSKWAHSHGLMCGAGARKMWQWSMTWAGKNLSSPVVSSRWPWVIVAASGLAAVLTAFHVLFLSKPRHVQDPDECFTIGSKEYCF